MVIRFKEHAPDPQVNLLREQNEKLDRLIQLLERFIKNQSIKREVNG